MFAGVPTRPAGAWHGARAETIHHATCAIAALSGDSSVKDLNRCGLLLEVARPLKVGTQHVARVTYEGTRADLPVRVTELTTHYEPGAPPRHRLGLMFRLQRDADYLALDHLLEQLNRSPAALAAAA